MHHLRIEMFPLGIVENRAFFLLLLPFLLYFLFTIWLNNGFLLHFHKKDCIDISKIYLALQKIRMIPIKMILAHWILILSFWKMQIGQSFSPLKDKSWLLNHIIYLRNKLSVDCSTIKLIKTPILQNYQVPNAVLQFQAVPK